MSEVRSAELKGILRERIEKVSELTTDDPKFSSIKKIAKLPWRLEVRKGQAQHAPPTLGVSVWCNWTNKSTLWSCKALVKFLIKSRDLDFVRNFEHVFSAKQPFVNWTRLLDPAGSVDSDSLVIEAVICVNDIIGYGVPPKEDQIFVNGKTFDVNRYVLAAHSPFFRAFFFDDKFRECRTQTFEINDKEVDADIFGMMLNCIYPDNGKPDDDNVETMLQLCDKYDLPAVRERCERFLIEQSRRCMVFKFRMAENYELTSLENHCLKSINTIEFCASLLENIAEFTECADDSQQKLSAHLAKLCETEKTKQNLATMLQNGMCGGQQTTAGGGGGSDNGRGGGGGSGSRPHSFMLLTDPSPIVDL